MKIEFNKINSDLNVALDGRLDTVTAPELESFLAKNFDGVGALTIDCEKLVYISSAGLRVLLAAHKRMKGYCQAHARPGNTLWQGVARMVARWAHTRVWQGGKALLRLCPRH